MTPMNLQVAPRFREFQYTFVQASLINANGHQRNTRQTDTRMNQRTAQKQHEEQEKLEPTLPQNLRTVKGYVRRQRAGDEKSRLSKIIKIHFKEDLKDAV